MAVTAAGTPYVESSDLVANYPGVSLALANHIDDLPSAVLQIVRATDTTARTTTSGTFVDVTGMSVTITPQKVDSALLIIGTCRAMVSVASPGSNNAYLQLTDSSNTGLSGAEDIQIGNNAAIRAWQYITLIAYATPATISPVTYKMRFKVGNADSIYLSNDNCTGQMYAIEVRA